MIRLMYAVSFLILLSGCAFMPQAITIKPKVDTPASDIGANRDLPLNVVDERPRPTLGTRGMRGVGADLTVEGDLTSIVRAALAEGLAWKKFKPTRPTGNAPRELRVEIRNLDYTATQGFWIGTLRVDAGLKGICIRNASRPYEKLYRGEHVESMMVVQSSEANNEYVSAAISAAVNSLLADEQLMTCLSQPDASEVTPETDSFLHHYIPSIKRMISVP